MEASGLTWRLTVSLAAQLIITSALYLAAGAFREALCVSYYRAVSLRRPLSASGLAGGIELYDLLVLAAILKSGFNPVLMAAYCGGVIIGTYVATRMSK